MMAQTVSARPPILENATVEKIPIAPITINAPAYQSKCAASNFTTVAAAFAGAAGWRLLKNVVSRSRSAALITPALAASRRSSSDHCIAVVSFSRTIAEKTLMVASYQCHYSAQGVAGWFKGDSSQPIYQSQSEGRGSARSVSASSILRTRVRPMSAFGGKADIGRNERNVR